MGRDVHKHVSKAKLGKTTGSFPDTYWIAIPNIAPGWTYIVVPNSGNLWLFYEYAQPAEQIFVWHQGGSTTPVNPGENNIAVGAGDMII